MSLVFGDVFCQKHNYGGAGPAGAAISPAQEDLISWSCMSVKGVFHRSSRPFVYNP